MSARDGSFSAFASDAVEGNAILFLDVVLPVSANVGLQLALTLISYWRMRRVVFVFLFCVALVVSRRPDVLFHAQFWAEDGKLWYADAYNLGFLQPFLHPAAGYFDTLPRLAALFAQILPFNLAPLALNCIGIVIQILPAHS